MRKTLTAVILGIGLAAAATMPAMACTFHDQASADQQQKTAQADTAQPGQTTAQ